MKGIYLTSIFIIIPTMIWTQKPIDLNFLSNKISNRLQSVTYDPSGRERKLFFLKKDYFEMKVIDKYGLFSTEKVLLKNISFVKGPRQNTPIDKKPQDFSSESNIEIYCNHKQYSFVDPINKDTSNNDPNPDRIVIDVSRSNASVNQIEIAASELDYFIREATCQDTAFGVCARLNLYDLFSLLHMDNNEKKANLIAKGFEYNDDIIGGDVHIAEFGRFRKKKSVIENISWNDKINNNTGNTLYAQFDSDNYNQLLMDELGSNCVPIGTHEINGEKYDVVIYKCNEHFDFIGSTKKKVGKDTYYYFALVLGNP